MLNFKDTGSGEPVVLIHGLFGNLDNLAACGRYLETQTYRIIRIDLANHGESPSQDPLDYFTMAADVIELLDYLQLKRCRILGHSMGGRVAMLLALLYPDRIQQLIVADIAPITYEGHHIQVFAGLDALWQESPGSRNEADQLLARWVTDKGVRQFLLKNLKWLDGKVQWRLRYQQVKANYIQILYWPSPDKKYLGPTLFIKGALSEYITEKSRAAIALHFPQAKAHIIHEAGHWLHAEKPEAFNRIAGRFFNR